MSLTKKKESRHAVRVENDAVHKAAGIHERAAKIKFVVSDMDGTLLGKDHLIPAENLQAVEALRAKGIRFTIATGRVDYMVREFTRQLNLREPIISCNGAMVRSLSTV